LLNALTGSEVLAEDMLFATLDPTTRRLRLPSNQNVLLSDTVGFIRKLPHGLVEAFKATLEEVVEADLLIHVVDTSHPNAPQQMEAVNAVLTEIGAQEKPMLMVFNKIDKPGATEMAAMCCQQFPKAVAVSARKKQGFETLFAELGAMLKPIREFVEIRIPHHEQKVMSRLHSVAQVVEQDYSGEEACFRVRLPPYLRHEFEHYLISSHDGD
jgi:GTP-binding protein HflX